MVQRVLVFLQFSFFFLFFMRTYTEAPSNAMSIVLRAQSRIQAELKCDTLGADEQVPLSATQCFSLQQLLFGFGGGGGTLSCGLPG